MWEKVEGTNGLCDEMESEKKQLHGRKMTSLNIEGKL